MNTCQSWLGQFMFSKIVVALSDLPESSRALHTAIEIATYFKSSLATVSVLGDLLAYVSYACNEPEATSKGLTVVRQVS